MAPANQEWLKYADEHGCRFLDMIRTPVKEKESEQAGKTQKYAPLSHHLALYVCIYNRSWIWANNTRQQEGRKEEKLRQL
jgi:hypothetical protein